MPMISNTEACQNLPKRNEALNLWLFDLHNTDGIKRHCWYNKIRLIKHLSMWLVQSKNTLLVFNPCQTEQPLWYARKNESCYAVSMQTGQHDLFIILDKPPVTSHVCFKQLKWHTLTVWPRACHMSPTVPLTSDAGGRRINICTSKQ